MSAAYRCSVHGVRYVESCGECRQLADDAEVEREKQRRGPMWFEVEGNVDWARVPGRWWAES